MAWTAATISAEIDRRDEWEVVLRGHEIEVLWMFQCWALGALEEQDMHDQQNIRLFVQSMKEDTVEALLEVLEQKKGRKRDQLLKRLHQEKNHHKIQEIARKNREENPEQAKDSDLLVFFRLCVLNGADLFFKIMEPQQDEVGHEDEEEGASFDRFND